MAQLNINSGNAIIKDGFCYSDYVHENPLVNKTADGKYESNSTFTKYSLKSDLQVPKSNNRFK